MLASLAVCLSCLPVVCQEPDLDTSSEEIAVLIQQLDGDRYETRKQAWRSLIRLGIAAIEPVEAAVLTQTENRELQTRGLEVLEALVFDGAPEVKQAASDSLVRIVMADTSNTAQRIANRILATYARAASEQAQEELRKLGAKLDEARVAIQIGPPVPGDQATQSISLGADWHGKPADLERLKLLPQLKTVSLSGPQITDDYLEYIGRVDSVELVVISKTKITARGLAHLGQLSSLQRLLVRETKIADEGDVVAAISNLKATQVRLIHTGLDDATVGRLVAAIPATKMSLHFGAFLGVGPVQPAFGEPGDQTKQCELGLVSPGSAADKAGLQEHDIITKYDGQPITHFEELREHIGHHSPGRVVKIEIQRAGKTLVKEVTLGELQ